ncbi:hypothetical protein AWC04_01925 [Mycolicibacterium fallax]|uniref:Uncharacterized protein n=1 Tax=Mycolicibacterium fallax TaxID=1793 RepID=A0A1X1RL53_MYCFA|nr:hypothetical protein AWC04_01925 [Mycolicibacterium fallax]
MLTPELSISSLLIGDEVQQSLIGNARSRGVGTDEGIIAEQHRYQQGQVTAVIQTLESKGNSVAVANMPTLVAKFDDVADMQFDHDVITVVQVSGRARSTRTSPFQIMW